MNREILHSKYPPPQLSASRKLPSREREFWVLENPLERADVRRCHDYEENRGRDRRSPEQGFRMYVAANNKLRNGNRRLSKSRESLHFCAIFGRKLLKTEHESRTFGHF